MEKEIVSAAVTKGTVLSTTNEDGLDLLRAFVLRRRITAIVFSINDNGIFSRKASFERHRLGVGSESGG